MKIKTYKLKAVIPTVNYGNLQPEIEMEGEKLEVMQEVGLNHIKELHSRFSDTQLKETTPQISEIVKLVSFNEGCEVEFDEVNHDYGGWLSGTAYVDRFYKKFDGKAVAKNCEKSWGVPAQNIQDMWASNAKVSADFGTIIHKTLEHYFNHKSIGNTIVENTEKEENPAMPKHPLLRSIIEGFERIEISGGEVLTEVFVTDEKRKRCGQIDRLVILDRDKKTCRVQDYKVNVSAEEESSHFKALEPYDKLPPNKLTKYQIQLSFYADLLEASGWTVEGIDVFVYENGWKFYQLDKLEICGN